MNADNVTIQSLNLTANIKHVPWAPQNDVLGHPRVQAFVSHGGINSLYEAAFHAKPLVTIPLEFDQLDNANKVTCCKLSAAFPQEFVVSTCFPVRCFATHQGSGYETQHVGQAHVHIASQNSGLCTFQSIHDAV